MDIQTYKTTKETLTHLASKLGVTVDDILSHCRKTELVDARSMIVAVLTNRPHTRQQDIAALLGISQAAVSKLLARHRALMQYTDYKNRFTALEPVIAGAPRNLLNVKLVDEMKDVCSTASQTNV